MPNGLFYLHSSDRFISEIRGVCLAMFINIPVLNANSVYPDQMLRSVASDWVYTVNAPFKGYTS